MRTIVVLRSPGPRAAPPAGAGPRLAAACRQGAASFAMTGNPASAAKPAASPGDQAMTARGLGTPSSRHSLNREYLPATCLGRSGGGCGNRYAPRSGSPCSARKIAPASSVGMSTAGRPIRLARSSSPAWIRSACSGTGCQNTRPAR